VHFLASPFGHFSIAIAIGPPQSCPKIPAMFRDLLAMRAAGFFEGGQRFGAAPLAYPDVQKKD
jgi:hypothetical protein